MARAVLRSRVTGAAGQARDEAGFFAQLRESGVLVRLRYSEINPAEVTGYAVALAGHTEPDGTPRWYGGGRLAAGLTLPRLRQGIDSVTDRVRALLVTSAYDLLAIQRIRVGQDPYWVLPSGGVEAGGGPGKRAGPGVA